MQGRGWTIPAALAVAAVVAALASPGAAAAATTTVYAGPLRLDLDGQGTPAALQAVIAGDRVLVVGPTDPPASWGACHDLGDPAMVGYGSGTVAPAPAAPSPSCLCASPSSECASGADRVETVGDTTTHTRGALAVAHTTRASTTQHDVIDVQVTVRNVGSLAVHDVVLRHVMGLVWLNNTPAPDAATSLVVLRPAVADRLVGTSDLGVASAVPARPLNVTAPVSGSTANRACPQTRLGPGLATHAAPWADATGLGTTGCARGAAVDVLVGDLAAGTSATFLMHYATARNETALLSILGPGGIDADLAVLVQGASTAAAASGAPISFAWAFADLPAPMRIPVDADADGVLDATDNCFAVPNRYQEDLDHDGQGDACDLDRDNDGILDLGDNCLNAANPSQYDNDRDAQGDACDADDDNDGVADTTDNCPYVANRDQFDADHDGRGEACQAIPDPPRVDPQPPTQAGTIGDHATPQNPGTPPVDCKAEDPCNKTPPLVPGKSAGDVQPAGVAVTPASGLDARQAAQVAATAAGATASLWWLLRRHGGWALVAALFSRQRGDEVLQHPTRQQILQVVEAEPGLHFQELVRRTGRSRGDVMHHVRTLERTGHVLLRRLAGRQLVFPGGRRAVLEGDLPGSPTARMLAAIRLTPGLSVSELADVQQASYGSAHYHMRLLQRTGDVDLREEGGVLRAYPAGVLAPAGIPSAA